ncbi:MAG: VOC family protein, partial [Solirubrobacteraceae bacterium]
DDPGFYHLSKGGEHARPGLDLPFLEHPHAAPGHPAAGTVHLIVWRVESEAALEFWEQRLREEGVVCARAAQAPRTLRFSDREGLDHELCVSSASDPALPAKHPEIPAQLALIGFEGVRAYSADPAHSESVLERLMGAVRRPDGAWELRGASRGGWIAFDPPPTERGRQGAGSVHHIAWATGDGEQPRWLERLNAAGVANSGVIDRHYFHSVYFREPGQVLYELATDEPGFTVDGPIDQLGRELILPPWLEPRRAELLRRLTPLPDPRAGWGAAPR